MVADLDLDSTSSYFRRKNEAPFTSTIAPVMLGGA